MKFTAFASAALLLASTCLVGMIDVDSHAWDTIVTRVIQTQDESRHLKTDSLNNQPVNNMQPTPRAG
ncbi:hypothetical protein FYZ36_03965 [Mobiluncus mulieris]|uniref:hypothetical protein n=1 Tax=Mobiluncus mulieris TaxID=2052 RepID=UPI0021E1C607|nr:hypothetical protein [Mobiluncus mulieris]MCU9993776.1 hypothetical protein [Mobiluncus mulieris]